MNERPNLRPWPHAPSHLKRGPGYYIVTGGTYQKERLFNTPAKLDLLTNTLLELAEQFEWELQAWAVMSNHYHFVGKSPEEDGAVRRLVSRLHGRCSRELNKMDGILGRTVLKQYWDTPITFEKSYYARVRYVMENPVRHKLVKVAGGYPWCSAGWFVLHGDQALQSTVRSFPIDQVQVYDDFD